MEPASESSRQGAGESSGNADQQNTANGTAERNVAIQNAFNQMFQELVSQGVPKSQAAAQALVYATAKASEKKVERKEEEATPLVVSSEPTLPPLKPETSVTSELASEAQPPATPTKITVEDIREAIFNGCSLFNILCDFFSAPNSAEIFPPRATDCPKYMQISHSLVDLDFDSVVEFFETMNEFDEVMLIFANSLQSVLEKLMSHTNKTPDIIKFTVKIILVSLCHPRLSDPDMYPFMTTLFEALTKLKMDGVSDVANYIVLNYDSNRVKRLVESFQQYITIKLLGNELKQAKLCVSAMSIFAVLQPLCYSDISHTLFENEVISNSFLDNKPNEAKEYRVWKMECQSKARSSSSSASSAASSSAASASASASSPMWSGDTFMSDYDNGASVITVRSMLNGLRRLQPCVMHEEGISSESIVLQECNNSYNNSESPRKRPLRTCLCIQCVEPKLISFAELFTQRGLSLTNQSFFSFPFVLSLSRKANILEIDSRVEMQQGVEAEYRLALMTGQRSYIPYLLLRVSRDSIVHDTISQISVYERSDFRKPLRVIFDNEEGVDAGGVRKEFYQVMTRQLLDPNFGMFKSYSESNLLWFNSDSYETEAEFELIGLLIAIAIYNVTIIDLKMPRCLYKKLKKRRCDLEDLKELDPALGRGLEMLLEHPGDVSELDMRFQVTYEVFGEHKTHDLVDRGSEVIVTNSNRQEYVDRYVKHVLEDSVRSQYNAFARGFMKVFTSSSLALFEPVELEQIICGSPTMSLEDLEKGARYDDGYTADSQAVQWLWSVVHRFDQEEKKQFLRFISGSDRCPIDGLASLKFVVSRNGKEDSRLPSAHTCFNHLLLPEYSSESILEERLKYAITHSEGFGLR